MNKRTQIARLMASLPVGYNIADQTMTVVGVSGSAFSFTVLIEAHAASLPDLLIDVSDDNGKVKRFANADDYIAQAVKAGVPIDALFIGNKDALLPKPFTGDIIKRTTNVVAGYNKKIVDFTARIVEANIGLQLLSETTAAEIAIKAERTAQRDSMVENKAFYVSEVARLNLILTPPVGP